MAKTLAEGKYRRLVEDISAIYEGLARKLVEAYWRIGRRIVEVEQDGAVRAGYGAGLLKELSGELSEKFGKGFSVDNLENMRRFYLTHRNSGTSRKLDWSQYVALLSVDDDRERLSLEARAASEGLTARELQALVRKKAVPDAVTRPVPAAKPLPELELPSGLCLGTCRRSQAPGVAVPEDHVLLDLGFFVHFAVPRASIGAVTVTDKPSYTYRGVVERVVDGDTLTVFLELGFGAVASERLRLRGIDAPETGTPEGEKAKVFLAGLLPPGTRVVVQSHRTDIYGRFVADVLFLPDGGSDEDILGRGVFVNREILDRGFAVRVK